MTYAQDTIVSANAADVFANVLDGLLLGAGWTLVESLTPGASTYKTNVYKSAGTGNQAHYDWYLALMWNTIGTEQQVEVIGGAEYDATTHTISGIPGVMTPSGNFAETVTGNLNGSYPVNVQTGLGFQWSSHGSTTQKFWFCSVVPSSAFGYWMSVTLDHVAIFTTIPGFFFVSTLDVDASWSGQPFDVADNPLVCSAGNNGAYPNIYGSDGISAMMIPNGINNFYPTGIRTQPLGSKLPIIEGNYLPAYAWKADYYMQGATGVVGTGTPPWDAPYFGDGFHVGQIIDYYHVYGGAVGDTIEIDGATYVLSGPIPDGSGRGDRAASIAVLVE